MTIYTGTIHKIHQRHSARRDDHIANGWRWSCSCGAEQNPDTHFVDKSVCERKLDQHLLSHSPQSNNPTTPATQDDEPLIAVEGAPDLICEGDEVIGVSGGLWMGKRGKVVGIMKGNSAVLGYRSQDRLLIKFEDPIDVPAKCFAAHIPPRGEFHDQGTSTQEDRKSGTPTQHSRQGDGKEHLSPDPLPSCSCGESEGRATHVQRHHRGRDVSVPNDSANDAPTNDVRDPLPPRDDASQAHPWRRSSAIVINANDRWRLFDRGELCDFIAGIQALRSQEGRSDKFTIEQEIEDEIARRDEHLDL